MSGAFVIILILYVVVGYALYRRKWPDGAFPYAPDPEVLRVRRIGRRRVLPLPDGGRETPPENQLPP